VQYRRADGKLPYEDSRAPIHNTKADIEELLRRDGCSGVQWTDDWDNHRVVLVWIHKKVLEDGEEFKIPYRITAEQTVKNPKAMFRALFWFLKSTIVTIAYGIVTYEEAFLPYIIQQIDGQSMTIAEQALPWLDKGQPALNIGGLVPRLGAGELMEDK